MAHLITIVDRAWELRQRVEAAREAATAAKRHYEQAQQEWMPPAGISMPISKPPTVRRPR